MGKDLDFSYHRRFFHKFWLEVALGSEQNRDITSWSLEIGILENEVPLPVKIDNTDTIMRGKVTEAWEVEDVGGLLQWREGSGDLWPRCACICGREMEHH